ncbi:MAG: sigma-70 family RNA polymerase sigma factor [Bacteroidota bacterium]
MFAFRKKYESYSDEALMELVGKGDERAFGQLYDRYATKMHHYFYRMLYRNQEKANDFTQDLFLKLVEKGASYDPKRKFSTWFYAVAGNMCKNEYRSRSRRGSTESMSEEIIRQLADPGMADPYFSNPIDRDSFDKELTQAIEQLEWPHRQCFVLRYQDELPIKQISEIVGCPEGTVKSRLYYATRKLSERLKSYQEGRPRQAKKGGACKKTICDEKQ